MSRIPVMLFLGTAAFAAGPAVAQDALPSGREVINRYVEAIGGRDVVMAQGGRYATGTFSIPSQGMSGTLEVFAQPPNKMKARVTLQGIGEILNGFDGTTAWATNPMMGPMILDSLQLEQTRQQADFYSVLYPAEQVAALETVSRGPFAAADSADCYKVKITTTWGEEYHEYFDVTSGLLRGSERMNASPMGSVQVVTTVSDWRDVEGMMVPFKSVQYTMGIEQVITMDSLAVRQIPDSVFALPPEIKALLEKP